MTLEENYRIVNDENIRLKGDQESMTQNIKKMNEERNEYKDKLESANYRITEFIKQIHHTEEINSKITKELDKARSKMTDYQRYCDSLEIQKAAYERSFEIQKRQLLEQVKTVSGSCIAEKEAREKWIERYEAGYKTNLEITAEITKLKVENQSLEQANKDLKIELEMLTKEHSKMQERYDIKNFDHSKIIKDLDKLKRELESTKGLLEMIENQHKQYVTRLRSENKKLINKQEIEIRIKEMEFEDIRSLFSQRIIYFNEMKLQSERDRIERRVVERRLDKTTKERDDFKQKFMTTYDQLVEVEAVLNETRYSYDDLQHKFNKINTLHEQA